MLLSSAFWFFFEFFKFLNSAKTGDNARRFKRWKTEAILSFFLDLGSACGSFADRFLPAMRERCETVREMDLYSW